MSKIFLVMNSQQAWELQQVYRDHVINENGPEMIVSSVGWRPLTGTSVGVAMVTLTPAQRLSIREQGDQRGLTQTGREATGGEILSTFGPQGGTQW